jgi:hypothetical protein
VLLEEEKKKTKLYIKQRHNSIYSHPMFYLGVPLVARTSFFRTPIYQFCITSFQISRIVGDAIPVDYCFMRADEHFRGHSMSCLPMLGYLGRGVLCLVLSSKPP